MIEQQLWAHQKQAIEMATAYDHRVLSGPPPCLGLFFEPGLGKSRTVIEIISKLYLREGRMLRTLIFAPKIVLINWQREFEKYSNVHSRDVVVLTGSAGRRFSNFIDVCSKDGVLNIPKVIVTNYEAVAMERFFHVLMDWRPEVVIADEAHRLKNPESKRAKAVIQLSDNSRYRYALTGSPILNSAMDLFNVFRFMDKGESFGKNFWKFRSVWFEDDNADWSGKQGYYPKYVPRPHTYKEFTEIVYKKAVPALKSKCLDLPPFIRQEVFVELSPEQKKHYDEMKRDYITWIESIEQSGEKKAIVAQMAVTKVLRLQQIVTGYAKTEDGTVHRVKDNPRLEALADLLEELSPYHKVIVWAVFHENYSSISALCEKLKIKYVTLTGQTKDKDRQNNMDSFNNDESVRVMIANQGAGGVGVNLVSSDIAIYFSKNFSLEHDIQSEARNYRAGSECHDSITRIDIIAPNTIDELITGALKEKQNIADKILDWKNRI